jgi:hypothetical protein
MLLDPCAPMRGRGARPRSALPALRLACRGNADSHPWHATLSGIPGNRSHASHVPNRGPFAERACSSQRCSRTMRRMATFARLLVAHLLMGRGFGGSRTSWGWRGREEKIKGDAEGLGGNGAGLGGDKERDKGGGL